jgi:hypothetical protein
VFTIFLGVSKCPGKLHEHAAQLPRPQHGPQAFFELIYVGRINDAIVRELASKLRSKKKLGIVRYLSDPQPRDLRPNGLVESGIDFDRVEVA